MNKPNTILDFHEKVALVTGGSSGIGKATAIDIAKLGGKVVLFSRSMEKLNAACDAVANFGGTAIGVAGEVSSETDVKNAVAKGLNAYGGIDILVNSAGTTVRHPGSEFPLDAWNEVIATNLTGTFLFCREVSKRMIQAGKGGKIVNVSSIVGSIARPNVVAYAASKGGVDSITRAYALELAPSKINVNAVAPGYVVTELSSGVYHDKAMYERITSRIPAGRWAEPDEISGAILFLCSRLSDYMTGQILTVDGGWTST
jgi:NAD(P)-dependent dehydrogenase (short-subunit alcohol dehydrogenase family)